MAWDLETAYLRTGLTKSPENDALLTAAMAASVALVEVWLNRKLAFAEDVEGFPMSYVPGTLTLRRYPLTDVVGVWIAPDQMVLPLAPPVGGSRWTGKFVADAETGLLHFPTAIRGNQVVVQYSGGYEEFPPDMELALWQVFDRILADSAGPGGSTGNLGAITSITVPDVGTVRFADASAGSGDGSGSSGDANPAIPDMARALLRPYRRQFT